MKYKIKEIPKSERPREKAIMYGVESLTNQELLAIIIKSGTKKESVLDIAKNILFELKNIKELKEKSLYELKEYQGIGVVKGLDILASIELGKRVMSYSERKITFQTPQDIYYFIKPEIDMHQEQLICMFLDCKCHLINKKTIYIGTNSKLLFNNIDIIRPAIKCGAFSIVLTHNHPSGDPKPSCNDIAITKKLKEALKIMGIELLDHVIIGDTYFSFNEHNII